MLTICRNDKNKIKEHINNKQLDSIELSSSNLVDDIILAMLQNGVLDCLNNGFIDHRKSNHTIPFKIIIALAIAAKMKIKTSLTDIPYAITSHKTLLELGYNIRVDKNALLSEGTIRHFIGMYTSEDIIKYYNQTVNKYIFKQLDIEPNIHILDCTKIAVNKENKNYELATWSTNRKNETMFGYKLASLRGLYNDSGLIEEVRFGTAATHDIILSEDILKNSPCLHKNDILLMDRGFFSRALIKHLKDDRQVDVYIPLKKNLTEYQMAITLAEELDDWQPHPYAKDQMICHVPYVDALFNGDDIVDFVPFNTCVVWREYAQDYIVFATTDMNVKGADIIKTYALRTEIEEDFRQLKDFWKLEDFKSTKFNVISFHIVCVLLGYLFYQLYINTKAGEQYFGKSLPVILKNYQSEVFDYLVLYSGKYFCIMSLKEFIKFRDSCSEEIRKFILEFLH